MNTAVLAQADPGGGLCSVPGISWGCKAVDAVTSLPGQAVQAAAGSAFESMVQSIAEGVGKAVGLMMSWWMNIPVPELSADGGVVQRLQGATLWLTVLVAIVSVFIVVIRMAMARRGGEAQELQEAGRGLVRLVLATSAAVPVVMLLSKAADEFSRWLVNQAADGDVGRAIGKLMAVNAVTGSTGLLFILALIALIASLVQAFFILIRDAMIILLIGTLPLAAAASMTPGGQHTWKKSVAWLAAFLLFKPVAAMCYAAALWAVSNPSSVSDVLAGMFLVILAVFTLPALMRLIVPAIERVGGGGGGGAAMGAVGGMATGAVSLGAMHGSGGRSTGTQPAAFRGAQGQQASGANATATGGQSAGVRPQGGPAGGGAAATAAKAHPVAAGVGAAAQVAGKGHQAVRSAAESATGEGTERKPR